MILKLLLCFNITNFAFLICTYQKINQFTMIQILDEPEEEKVDWLAILKEGEQSPSPLGSESELSGKN